MKVLSLGLGVQSTALYYMSSMGLLPRFDYAIFSDPGAEKKETYQYLKKLLKWEHKHNGIPIIWRKDRNILTDLLNGENSRGKRFASIPAFTSNDDGTNGMLRRQCTGEYKIQIVNNTIRELYGLKARQRFPKTEIWMGITLDEIQRVTIPQNKWQTFVYPFLGYSTNYINKCKKEPDFKDILMDRNNVTQWYKRVGLPVPPRSACVFCPFQSDREWQNIKSSKSEFKKVIKTDQSIRNSSKKGITQPIYLHRSLQPIDKIKFVNLDQISFDESECSGFCRT